MPGKGAENDDLLSELNWVADYHFRIRYNHTNV